MIATGVMTICLLALLAGGIYDIFRSSDKGKNLLSLGFLLAIGGLYISRVLVYSIQMPIKVALILIACFGTVGCFYLGWGIISIYRTRKSNKLVALPVEANASDIAATPVTHNSADTNHLSKSIAHKIPTTKVSQTFFQRAMLRTTSFFWFIIFIVTLPFVYVLFLEIITPVLKTEEMPKITATLIEWKNLRKGSDKIVLKNDKGELVHLTISLGNKTVDMLNKLVGRKVVVYYQNQITIFLTNDRNVRDISFNDEFLMGYNYERSLKLKGSFKTWFKIFVVIFLFSAFRIWWVNRKPTNKSKP